MNFDVLMPKRLAMRSPSTREKLTKPASPLQHLPHAEQENLRPPLYHCAVAVDEMLRGDDGMDRADSVKVRGRVLIAAENIFVE